MTMKRMVYLILIAVGAIGITVVAVERAMDGNLWFLLILLNLWPLGRAARVIWRGNPINRVTLEDRITGGYVSYIDRIDYDQAKSRIVIEFVNNPEECRVDRRLEFLEVEEFSDVFHDEDEDDDLVVDLLIDLTEHPRPNGTVYVVYTVTREMVFRTKQPPTITRVAP